MNPIVEEVMSVLDAMAAHAAKERAAIRSLDTRALFELAAEGESLTRKLQERVSRVDADTLGTAEWGRVRARCAELKALRAGSAAIAKRCVDVVKGLKKTHSPNAGAGPAFFSQRA